MSQVPVPPESLAGPPPSGPLGAPAGPVPTGRATFWQRFLAALLDGILIGIVSSLLNAIFGDGRGLTVGYIYNPEDPSAGAIQLVIAIIYSVYFHGSPSGQTVGKKVRNIRLVGDKDGAPVGYGTAALRYLASILSTIVCLLGYLWMLWDDNKQTWHDKIASTIVVPESAAPVGKWPG